MRRVAGILILLLALASALPGQAEEEQLTIFINGQYVYMSELTGVPFIRNSRVMVPLRAVVEMLGAQVEWIPLPRSVRITKEQRNIMVVIDKTYAVVDGRHIKLDAAATIENGRTYVPLRFVGEALGMQVRWDGERRAAYLEDPEPGSRPAEAMHVELTLEALPAQGAELTVLARITDAAGQPVASARAATLEMFHRREEVWVQRNMYRTDQPGTFVGHIGLFTQKGHVFDLRTVVHVGDQTVVGETEVTVADGQVDPFTLDQWAPGGFRPHFITPMVDLETGLTLPASIQVAFTPNDPEQGAPMEFRIQLLDAFLRPVQGLGDGSVLLLQWASGIAVKETPATEVAPGLYEVKVPALFAGFGGTVTWEARALAESKLLTKLQGSYMTR